MVQGNEHPYNKESTEILQKIKKIKNEVYKSLMKN
jgi:hypothetical protein